MKKFLKTPEEVVEALKEGKTVYSGCGKYRMHNGIVVQENVNYFTVNPCLLSTENLYIEEPEPFKIEVGKFYKTRGGKKARCFFIDKDSARCTIDGCFDLFWVYLETGCSCSDVPKSDYDIIGPWEE